MPEDPSPTHATNLHAPWRRSYMDMLSAQMKSKGEAGGEPQGGPALQSRASAPATSSNFLRDYWLHPERDDANHVIVRTGTEDATPSSGGLILLNRYPYANGHLLVCLAQPRMRLLDYTPDQRAELWSLVDLAVELCEKTLEPQGVNVGLNQGAAAGAGVPEHVHVHVVPRWGGDVNFMSAVASIRVIPSALDDMARRYRATWGRIRPPHRT